MVGKRLSLQARIGAYPSLDPDDPVDIHSILYHCTALDPQQPLYDALRRPSPLSTGRVFARRSCNMPQA